MTTVPTAAPDAIWRDLTATKRTEDFLKTSAAEPRDAYLFVGPDRTKTEAARVFAAAIVCREGCGKCETCRRVMAGLHPDVQVFGPEGYTFPVELIREMVTAASQSPLESDRRVFIVEEADRITELSQNALLKALEEPGHSVTWVLTSDSLEPLLPTVLSRCQVVEFPAMGEEAIAAVLESRLNLGPEESKRVAGAAAGDLEKAIALATDEIAVLVRAAAFAAAAEQEPGVAWGLGTAERVQHLAMQARSVAEESHQKELAEFDESMGKGRGSAGARKRLAERHKRALRRAENDVYLGFLSWLGAAYRDLAAASCGAPTESLIAPEFADQTRAAALSRGADLWLGMAHRTAEAQLAIKENAHPPLALESVLLRQAKGSA